MLMILKQKLDSQKAGPAEVTTSSISLSSCISITTATTTINTAKNSKPPKKNTDLAYFPRPIPIPISKSPKILRELCLLLFLLLHFPFIPYKKHRSALVEITKEDYQ